MTAEALELRAQYSNVVAGVTTPSEGLTIPLEADPDGRLRTFIKAEAAQFFTDSPVIWAKDLSLTKVGEDGKAELQLDAERCIIDRVEKRGWVDGHTRIVQGETVFEGDGIYFSSSNHFVTSYSGSEVRTSGINSGTNHYKSATIRARRADMDREDGVIMFEGGVSVHYSDEYSMNADRIFAFLRGSNTLSRIVATGGVAITNKTRSGSCAMAVYRDRERRVEMYGSADSVARLVEGGGKRNDVIGSKITFWIDAEQVEVIAPEISLEEKNVR